ncbi:MAG: response regulator [bacterium]
MEKRILLVDNESSELDAWKFNLEQQGYMVFSAGSPDEAKELLKKERVHLAVIDLKLIDHNDDKDTSGIELAKRIDSIIPKIILTGFDSYETGRMARSPRFGGIAFDYISKKDPPSSLIETIEDAFNKVIKINFNLKVRLEEKLSSGVTITNLEDEKAFEFLLEEIFIKGKDSEEEKKRMSRELGEIFKRLFYKEHKIIISVLSSKGYSGTGVVWVTPGRSDQGVGAPLVVKFGGRKAIETEERNYDNYVAPYLTRRCTKRGEVVYTQNFGGIGYTLVGRTLKDICDFRTYYGKNDKVNITRVLKDLFKETCELWYRNKGNPQDLNLKESYKKQLGCDQKDLDDALKKIFSEYKGKHLINFSGLEKDFINPVVWLKDKLFSFPTYRCCTHGDLNGKNILVDEDGHTWLIDFFRTGYGHILRDFVELEADIKFNYLETSNIETLYEFEKSLVSPEQFDEPYSFKSPIEELNKAFAVIQDLRNLAHSFVQPCNNIYEYYIGLLYHTINMIRYPNIKKERLRHALLSSSLICERLDKK